MKNIIDLSILKSIHFVGVGGISMSALAKYFHFYGVTVTGSDRQSNSQTKTLLGLGIKIYYQHSESNVGEVDVVVYSSAIDEENVELKTAVKKGIPIFKRSELLCALAKQFKNSVAVSGSHGKTTTTSMIAHILKCANVNPTAFIGGDDQSLSNCYIGQKNHLVFEACEYKKNILYFKPTVAVVLNIDNDHLDSYENMNDMVDCFKSFIRGRISVVNADDEYAKKIVGTTSVTFSINNKANFTAKNIKSKNGAYSFTVVEGNRRLGRINLSVIGRHNIYNALASIATCYTLGIDFYSIKLGLEKFSGVCRRMEYLGTKNKVKYYSDYAHHPKEIEATLTAFNRRGSKDLIIFQPHTYSRTKFLINDFIKVLSKAERVIIYKTYSAREPYDIQGDAYTLYKKLKKSCKGKVVYAKNVSQLFESISILSLGVDRVLTIGAGNLYDLTKKYLRN